MSYFLFKRVLTLLATLLATSVIVFAVLEVLPGNAAQVLTRGADATQVYYPGEVSAGEEGPKSGEGTKSGGETADQDGQS